MSGVMLQILLEVAAAALGTAAFGILFHVPNNFLLRCGVIGGCGWLGYRVFALLGLTPAPAIFLANTVVVFLSRFSAVRRFCPVTLFLIPGIFPLVPGAGIYWTAYYLVTNEVEKAATHGFSTVKSAVAIVLSILMVFELPQNLFRVLNGMVKKRKGEGRTS